MTDMAVRRGRLVFTRAIPILTSDQASRFWSRATKTNGCWLWTGAPVGEYPRFRVGGANYHANRIAWELSRNDKIPAGMVVRHACDDPRCINPDHLVLGTQLDNALDRSSRGRSCAGARRSAAWQKAVESYGDHWLRGEHHLSAKLTEAQVREVRRLRESGLSLSEIGRRFSVSHQSIRAIVVGKSWRHVS